MSDGNDILYGIIGHVEDAADCNVVVATARRRDDPIALHRLSVTDELAQEFRDAVYGVLPDDENDVILVPYDPTYRPQSHELMLLALDDAPEIAELVDLAADVSAAPHFTADETLIRQLRFYVTVVSSEDDQALFFRTYSAKKELTRSRGFAAMFDDGVFQKVEHKTFLFDDDADCFVWGEHMFIRHVSAFHRIFRYFEQLRENADETLDQVLQHVPISNEDDFRTACKGQLQMLAKLANISQKPYLPNLTMGAIEDTIDTVGLGLEVVNDDGERKLVFDPSTQESRWAILKLLDDDYLRSLMTQELYEASSKIQLS
jgi:hypothetical protein